jgi:ABC-type Fe3+/spermidine/putrescine transport system ATPase subunit
LLLDEPFSNLDMAHKTILKTVIRDIGEKLAISLILISHDPQDTLSWADQVLVMKEGQLLQQGTPEQIYRQPVNTYVAALFGNYNLMPASQGAAFESLGGIKSAKEFLLIRPERFKITATDNGGLPGQVRKVIFFGSYYELQVQLVDINITVQTGMNQFSPGDWVYLSVQPDDVWYL